MQWNRMSFSQLILSIKRRSVLLQGRTASWHFLRFVNHWCFLMHVSERYGAVEMGLWRWRPSTLVFKNLVLRATRGETGQIQQQEWMKGQGIPWCSLQVAWERFFGNTPFAGDPSLKRLDLLVLSFLFQMTLLGFL